MHTTCPFIKTNTHTTRSYSLDNKPVAQKHNWKKKKKNHYSFGTKLVTLKHNNKNFLLLLKPAKLISQKHNQCSPQPHNKQQIIAWQEIIIQYFYQYI